MVAPQETLEVGGRVVRVSNPGKVYFPARGFTKMDVVEYVIAVGERLLAGLRNRPTTLERYPDGVDGEAFFQKRVPKGAPSWVRTARITFPSGRPADEVCPTEVAVLAWAANLGTVTFHPWPVRDADVDLPDELRVDLDPQPGTDYADAVRAAHELRAVLAAFGMSGWPKTSGGRGVHVYVPIQPRWTFTEVRRALIALARQLERRLPDGVTTSWWKEERGSRVFVDYNQAARDRTIASPYSLRPRPRATVSAPVRWDELDRVVPEDFDLASVPARMAEPDPWADMGGQAYSLEALLEQADRDQHDGYGDLPYPPDHPKMPGEPMRVQPSRARNRPTSS